MNGVNMEQLPAFQLKAGDRIVGLGDFGPVVSYRYAGETNLGSTRERQHYTVTFASGRQMTVNADHKFGVIR